MPRATRSPWIEQLGPLDQPLAGAVPEETDVVVVGAGIVGVATSFFLLRDTDRRVLLLERNRVARGATGHNAGALHEAGAASMPASRGAASIESHAS